MRTTAATYPTITAWIGCLAFAVAAANCKASSNQGSGNPATGGSSSAGGTSSSSASSASGGSSATGGSTSTGGSSATGGSTSTGGSSDSGGSTSVGGSSDSGGSTSAGGSSAAGGSTSAGGSSATGGSTSAGGSSAAGGSTSAGGSSAAGGSTSAGGATSSGGSSATGGTTPTLGCSAALIPPNGNVTDFSDWDPTAGKWGNTAGFYGAVFSYGGLTQVVDTINKNFHITGTLASGAFGGAGLSFYACATVTTFNSFSFTIAGTAPGCDITLQIQTFDQLPTTNTPPGGCTSNCYGFPSKGRVAIPSATPTVVNTVLGTDLSNWSQASAAQVVGIQWQFSVPQLADGGTAISCPIDVTIDDVKFAP